MLFIIGAAALAIAPAGSKIAVVGATGKVGRQAVQQLSDRGFKTRVLTRHAVDAAAEPGSPSAVLATLTALPGVEAVAGDVTSLASCDALLEGCSAVLALHGARRTRKLSDLWSNPEDEPGHSKQVNYAGVANLIRAARASGTCTRIVRLTGKGETPWSIFSILINGLGSMAKAWNYEGEQLLLACDDLEYTIVRPGVMRGDEAELPSHSLALADDGADLKVTAIPHATIARLCVDSLSYGNAGRCTLCAMQSEAPGEGADAWGTLLETVQPDRRAFRDDLLQAHKTATRVGGAALVAALGGGAAALLLALKAAAGALVALVTMLVVR